MHLLVSCYFLNFAQVILIFYWPVLFRIFWLFSAQNYPDEAIGWSIVGSNYIVSKCTALPDVAFCGDNAAMAFCPKRVSM